MLRGISGLPADHTHTVLRPKFGLHVEMESKFWPQDWAIPRPDLQNKIETGAKIIKILVSRPVWSWDFNISDSCTSPSHEEPVIKIPHHGRLLHASVATCPWISQHNIRPPLVLKFRISINLLGTKGPKATYKSQHTIYNDIYSPRQCTCIQYIKNHASEKQFTNYVKFSFFSICSFLHWNKFCSEYPDSIILKVSF